MWAMWHFSRDMPCIQADLPECDYHGTDHNGFLLMVGQDHHVEVPVPPLGAVAMVDEVEGTHMALATGYRC